MSTNLRTKVRRLASGRTAKSDAREIRQILKSFGSLSASDQILILVDVEHSNIRDQVRCDIGEQTCTWVSVDGRAQSGDQIARSYPRPSVVIDATVLVNHDDLFRSTFWALREGGTYCLLSGPAWWGRIFVKKFPRSPANPQATKELAQSIDNRVRLRRTIMIRKRQQHFVVVRHDDIENVLAQRFGEDWGQVIHRQASYSFVSRAKIVMHGDPADGVKHRTIDVPELAIREYVGAVVRMRDISTYENLILPDSYRHWQNANLFHKRIVPVSKSFGRLTDEVISGSETVQPGSYFSLDSAFPTHFGHLMTETLSRLWGWRIAQERFPDLRPVMTHQSGKKALPTWKREILESLDMPIEKILWVKEGQSFRVEHFVSAMPQLVNPHYVDANIGATWNAIKEGIQWPTSPSLVENKIFLSRKSKSQRSCSNNDEVESYFARLGFLIVQPERLPFSEQVKLFSQAKVIAGFAGSALFNAMFNSDAVLLVLSSRSYVAANEYLIASVNGNEIHYFWAPPTVEQPPSGFSTEAYRSGFEFPLRQHKSAIERLCR